MKKRNMLVTLLVSLFLTFALGACKRGHYYNGFDEFDQEAAAKRIASRLDLSDAQRNELQGIIGEVAAKAKAMHADREARHQELANLVRQESISFETVDRMITEKFDRMRELADAAAERLVAFHATLTPEQREKLARHIEAHGEGRCWFNK